MCICGNPSPGCTDNETTLVTPRICRTTLTVRAINKRNCSCVCALSTCNCLWMCMRECVFLRVSVCATYLAVLTPNCNAIKNCNSGEGQRVKKQRRETRNRRQKRQESREGERSESWGTVEMNALGQCNCHRSQQWLRLEPRAGYARNEVEDEKEDQQLQQQQQATQFGH